jgi:hypothetical protein
MRTVQIQTVSRLALASALGIDQTVAFRRLGRLVAAMLGRRPRGDRNAVPHYEGHAWCDSLEQQVNGDVMGCRRPRF